METPPQERVTAPVDTEEEGRILKVLFLDDQGDSVGQWQSSQLPENPFQDISVSGIQEPPFRLEQLLYLAEMHPVHSAALEQKTIDICGRGWEWSAADQDNADETLRDELEAWLESLAPDDMDMKELVYNVWLDVETLGWGLIELARDEPEGAVRRLYHVPGHTVRAHRDGFKLLQIRDARRVWFRRWGSPEVDGKPVQVDMKTGSMKTVKTPANDLLVIKRPSRRSSWYGIPGYVSAIGWLTLALAARDDNLHFFSNRREPRWAMVLKNLQNDPNIEEDLRRAFRVDLAQPYRNVMIPIQGQGEIDFQQLSDTSKNDGSFRHLSEQANKAIMIAHRVPADRLANSDVGPLGGSIVGEASRVYKESVVTPGQEVLANRLNRLIAVEWPKRAAAKLRVGRASPPPTEAQKPSWTIGMADLDIETDREELDLTVIAFHSDLITLREARHRLRLGPLMVAAQADPETGELPSDPETGEPYDEGAEVESPHNEKLFTELPGAAGGGGAPGQVPPGAGRLTGPVSLARDPAITQIETEVRELLQQSQDTHDALRAQAA